jgi:hypothetical protein
MTITISEQDWEAWEEERSHLIEYPDPDDRRDVLIPEPAWLAQGYTREIDLRDGLSVRIDDYQMRDRCEIAYSSASATLAVSAEQRALQQLDEQRS